MEQFGTGSLISKKDYRDIPVSAAIGAPPVSFPKEFFLDISLLPVWNQRKHGSCVGHATAKKHQKDEVDETGKAVKLSPRFIQAICKALDEYEGEGTYPRIAMKVWKEYGCATENTVVNDSALPYEAYVYQRNLSLIPQPAFEEARKYRIKSYAAVGLTKAELMHAITNTNGVMLSLDTGDTWHGDEQLPIAPPTELTGRHLVYLYGWETVQEKTVFHFINSWGTKWGEKGIGSFIFEDYKDLLNEAWSSVDLPNNYIEQIEALPVSTEFSHYFDTNLSFGTKSPEVMKLQAALKIDGAFPTAQPLTDYYGPITREAVYAFQKKYKIDFLEVLITLAGQSVGSKTRAKLNELFAKKKLIAALITVESGGNDNIIGDHHLPNKAYGCLQIRKPCIDDVNLRFGTSHKPQDMLGNRPLSIWTFERYMEIYATQKAIGRIPTPEDKARIWNAGPGGWKTSAADGYWAKVRKVLTLK